MCAVTETNANWTQLKDKNSQYFFHCKVRVKCWGKIAGEKDRITLLLVKSQNRIRNNLPSKQTNT